MSDWNREQLPNRKGKVTSLNHYMKDGVHQQDAKGNYRHFAVVEGDENSYSVSTRDPEGKAWSVGKEVPYTPYKMTHPDKDKPFYSASIVRDTPYSAKGPAPKNVRDYLADAAVTSATAAATLLSVKDGASAEEFPTYYRSVYQAVKAEIKEIFGGE